MPSRPQQNAGKDSPDITVSIVNWNTRDELANCLESVFAQEGADYEVIVVDNGSRDGSADMVASRFPQVRLIANKDNRGFSRAQNQALAASRGRYVMMLNPDARIVESDSLAKLVAFGDSEPQIGVIGVRILNVDGSLQFSARRFPTLGAGVFRNTFLGRLFPKNRYVKEYLMTDWKHDEVRDVDWVSGAALTVRREALEDIGSLDERFFMYCEDVDFCHRAHGKGWRVCYFPRSTVIHRIAASSDLAQIRMIYQFHRSMRLFFQKHYSSGWPLHTRLIVLLGLTARMSCFIALNMIKRAVGKRGSRSG
ncbi:MAG: glycosyltransferase family 2 protein [Armatimonadota bacterium]|nr:glycosyltransferase family 2 protein [Armatimonadota bacterium]